MTKDSIKEIISEVSELDVEVLDNIGDEKLLTPDDVVTMIELAVTRCCNKLDSAHYKGWTYWRGTWRKKDVDDPLLTIELIETSTSQ